MRKTMTVYEVAEFIGVSKDLIYELVRAKQIPHLRIGKRIIFNQESLENWLIKKEIKAAGQEAE
jgi:excisionase family DNA binding protein